MADWNERPKAVMEIQTKRAYAKPAPQDGLRVLVDRVWPRGVRKEDLQLDDWMKELAPSTQLRKWFGHASEKWDEFRRRYFTELDQQKALARRLAELATAGRVTLIFAAKDELHNNAVALKEYLSRFRK